MGKMDGQWTWQDSGKAWKGIGIYHVTLVVPSREPLLGKLVIPDDDPTQAKVERTELGKGVVCALAHITELYPDIRLLQYTVMPDHLHAILYVTRVMDKSIRTVLRGFWQGVKKLGRTYISSIDTNSIRNNERNSETDILPVFTEQPFIRPLSRKGQLKAMIRYVQMNPQRLATKRLKPGYFCVQHGVEINGRTYDAVGNIALLQADKYMPVHVRRTMVEAAEHGDNKVLRDYMNSCVLVARTGTVMVSPFISPKEREVLAVLVAEGHPIIYLADNGFGEYYKPSDGLFEMVAKGQMIILSPWQHEERKRPITRAECVALNNMAEEICNTLNNM